MNTVALLLLVVIAVCAQGVYVFTKRCATELAEIRRLLGRKE